MSLLNEKKLMSISACRQWLIQHGDDEVRRFIEHYYDRNVINAEFQRMLQEPVASYYLVKQFYMTNKTKHDYMINKLSKNTGYICVVAGGKGSGKTAWFAHILTHLLMRGCKIAYVGMPQSVPYFLNEQPLIKKKGGQVKFYFDLFSVPQDYIIFQDESAIIENAKNFQDKQQKEREDILPILRHKGNSVIYVSQQFKFLSKRIRDFCDYFIFKKYNLMALMKDDEDAEFPFPSIYKDFIPKDQNSCLFIDGLTGIYSIQHDVPAWYKKDSDKWGKSFKNIENQTEAEEFIQALVNNGYQPDRIRHFLRLRGYERDLNYYKQFCQQE